MKFRSASIHRLHHRLFDCAVHKWKSKDALGIYSLQWGLEHGLVVHDAEGVIGMLTDISFLRAFHDKYSLPRLVTYWHVISPREDGRVYQRSIEIRLEQPVNRNTAQEMNSIMTLFHHAKKFGVFCFVCSVFFKLPKAKKTFLNGSSSGII